MTNSQPTHIRTFIAIPLSKNTQLIIKNILNHLQNQFGNEKIKWSRIHNIHLTLHFLGQTEFKKIPELTQYIHEAIQPISTFQMMIDTKPIIFNPHIIALKITPHDSLLTLVDIIKQVLIKLNLKTENRLYIPHITLGRIKIPIHFELSEQLTQKFIAEPIQELILFKSEPQEHESLYTSLAHFHLKTTTS